MNQFPFSNLSASFQLFNGLSSVFLSCLGCLQSSLHISNYYFLSFFCISILFWVASNLLFFIACLSWVAYNPLFFISSWSLISEHMHAHCYFQFLGTIALLILLKSFILPLKLSHSSLSIDSISFPFLMSALVFLDYVYKYSCCIAFQYLPF